jgi:hypothetical protein
MDLFESYTHSFVIKIWLEESVEEVNTATWRGKITHVPGGENVHFLKLADIPLFIMPYLKAMGVQSPWRYKVRQWLKKK